MKLLNDLKEFAEAKPEITPEVEKPAKPSAIVNEAPGGAPSDYWRELPPLVQLELGKLHVAERVIFDQMYAQEAKNICRAYGYWLLLGSHHLYLNKPGKQLLFWLTFPTILIPLVWWLEDIRRLYINVKKYNDVVAIRILKDIKLIRTK